MRVHVIGLGNLLHGDDGFGPEVCRLLAAEPLPPDVRVIDAGTAGPGAILNFEHCDRVIVLDALAVDCGPAGARVGEVQRGEVELPSSPADRPAVVRWTVEGSDGGGETRLALDPFDGARSTHALGLPDLLRALPIALGADAVPPITLIGALVEQVQPFQDQLSPAVQVAAERTCRALRAELLRGDGEVRG